MFPDVKEFNTNIEELNVKINNNHIDNYSRNGKFNLELPNHL